MFVKDDSGSSMQKAIFEPFRKNVHISDAVFRSVKALAFLNAHVMVQNSILVESGLLDLRLAAWTNTH